ncbi:MAG TPA: high-potential iron-sulfur protein [Rhodocyclaceae bacterium]|nr:high-potential iron-sulfur protein [Rhodocyclaceae bacterium]
MLNRRRFITLVPIATVGVMLSRSAAAQTKLTEADPTAQALGYKEDASKVDTKKYAAYKPGNTCANCVQYSGKPGDASGPCAAFGGKAVTAKGWCMAWVKKA